MKKHPKISAVVAAIILLAVVGLVWWLLAGSSKPAAKDYRSAQAAAQTLRTSYLNLEASFNAYRADAASTTNKTAYTKAYDDYQAKQTAAKTALDKLGDQAVLADYTAFKSKSDGFTGYMRGYVDDYAVAQRLLKADCVVTDKIMSGTVDTMLKDYDSRVQACQPDIATLKSSSNVGLADFGTALTELMQERRVALTTVQSEFKKNDVAAAQAAITKVLVVKTPDLAKVLTDARQETSALKQLETMNNTLAQKTAAAYKAEAAS